MYPVPDDLLPICGAETPEELPGSRTSGERNRKSSLRSNGLLSRVPEQLSSSMGKLIRIVYDLDILAQSSLQALPSFRRSPAASAGPSLPEAYT